jgi:hypothetical protein
MPPVNGQMLPADRERIIRILQELQPPADLPIRRK